MIKKTKHVYLIIVLVLGLGGISCMERSIRAKNTIEELIINDIRASKDIQGKAIEIRISDYTDFEWDKMLVHEYKTEKAIIDRELNIDFEDDIDLESGIIFVYDGEIIYQERWPIAIEGQPRFMIYPYKDKRMSYRTFNKDEAVFRGNCGIDMFDGEEYYWLDPSKD